MVTKDNSILSLNSNKSAIERLICLSIADLTKLNTPIINLQKP